MGRRNHTYRSKETAALVGPSGNKSVEAQAVHKVVTDILSPTSINFKDPEVARQYNALPDSQKSFIELVKNPRSDFYNNPAAAAKASGITHGEFLEIMDRLPELGLEALENISWSRRMLSKVKRNMEAFLDIDEEVTRVDKDGNMYQTTDSKLVEIKYKATIDAGALLQPDVWQEAKGPAAAASGSSGVTVNIVSVNNDKSYKIGHVRESVVEGEIV